MVKYLRDELDLLLATVDLGTGERARAILTEHGIHSMLHSSSFEMPVAVGAQSRYCQLYVRKGAKTEARAHLTAAWGRTAVDKLVPHPIIARMTRARGAARPDDTSHGT